MFKFEYTQIDPKTFKAKTVHLDNKPDTNRYNLTALQTFKDKYGDKIANIKVTRIIMGDFNEMEGYQYYINVKVFYNNGRTQLIKIQTNSTYIDTTLEELVKEIESN